MYVLTECDRSTPEDLKPKAQKTLNLKPEALDPKS